MCSKNSDKRACFYEPTIMLFVISNYYYYYIDYDNVRNFVKKKFFEKNR